MRSPISRLIAGISLAVAAQVALFAAVPRTIPFQAAVRTAAGAPVTGSTAFTFRLYGSAGDAVGTELWSETQTLTPANGLVAATLGSATPLNLPFDRTYFVGVQAGGDPEMAPRIPLAAVPYALALPNVTVSPGGRIGIASTAPAGVLDVLGQRSVPAGELLDQAQSIVTGVGTFPQNTGTWQSFTARLTGTLTGLDLYIGGGSAPWSATLRWFAGQGTGGALLGSQDISGPQAAGWNTIVVSPGIPVQADAVYTFQVVATSAQGISVYGSVNDTYADGGLAGGGQDLSFRTRVTVPAGSIPWHIATARAENGNVGIGTTNPAAPLDVVGANPYPHLRVAASSLAPYGAFLSLDATATAGGNDWYIYSTGGSAGEGQGLLAFQNHSNSVIPLVLGPTGNVGIGTTAPTKPLHVAGAGGIQIGQNATTGGYTALLMSLSAASGGYADIQAIKAAGSQYGNLILNRIAGAVGIGTSAPAYTLDVNGTIRGANVSPSDARLKTNVRPLTGALDTVLSLRGVTFDWRRDLPAASRFPSGRQVGFIAQEVERTLPEVVSTAPDGTKSVSYESIVPVLVEALKQQQAELAQRDATIAAMEARLRRLEERSVPSE